MTMMHTMMNGGMGLMMSGMVLGTTLWILLLVILAWALLTWLKRRWGRPQPVPDTLYPSYSYHRYEQGYHPAQPMQRSDWEGDYSRQPKQQFDQPYVPYPLEQELPPQF